MPSFPTQTLTGKYISQSYQRVMQVYAPTGSTYYMLDGTGSVIFSFPSSSYGGSIGSDNSASLIFGG